MFIDLLFYLVLNKHTFHNLGETNVGSLCRSTPPLSYKRYVTANHSMFPKQMWLNNKTKTRNLKQFNNTILFLLRVHARFINQYLEHTGYFVDTLLEN